MRKLLQAIGILYDPDTAVSCPFQQDQDTKPRTAKAEKPDNLVYVHGIAYTQEQIQDGYQWDRYTGQDVQRSEQLTGQEERILSTLNLDTVKAAQIKPHWAAGLSAGKTATQFQGQRGYGKRTIEKYFSVFNNPSPGEKEEGDRKSTEKNRKRINILINQ